MSKVADRNQRQLLELLKLPGNEVCADCRSRNPRWASWDHGIFICVLCAGIHRKMGTHISKVKSLTLDTWSREQVEHMKGRGNNASNAELNPDEANRPPPSSADEGERESQLEKIIRDKYEYRSFVSATPRRPAPSPAPVAPIAAPLLAKPPPQVSRRSPSPAPPAPPLPPRAHTSPPSNTIPLTGDSTPTIPPRPFAEPLQSSTPSPEGKKSVRFRAASVPIADSVIPLRVPSRAGDKPAKSILRPRSATSASAGGGMEIRSGMEWANSGTMSGATASSLGLGTTKGVGGQARTASNMSTASFASMMSQGSATSNGSTSGSTFMTPSAFAPSNSSTISNAQLQQPAAYRQAMRAFSSSPSFAQSATPSPLPPPPQPQRLNSSIWDDLDALGSVGGTSAASLQTQRSSTPNFAYSQQAQQQQSSLAPSNSPFDTRATSPFDSSSSPAYTSPAPLRPQLTGFVPSSQFGQQLASGLPPTSSSDSAPFLRPQQTGYHPPPSFQPQQQQPQQSSPFYSPSPASSYGQQRPPVSTNPFQSSMLSPSPMNMSSLGATLPQIQTPMQTGGGTNPFFSGYQPQQQTQMQPQATGVTMQGYGGQTYGGAASGFGGGGYGVGNGGYQAAPMMPQATGQQFASTNPFFGYGQQQQQQQQQQYGGAWGA